MNSEVSESVQRFIRERKTYERAAAKIKARVHSIADQNHIICSVSGRAKDPRSFHKKIVTKNYGNPWKEVTDKAGVRAVVEKPSDVDLLQEVLERDFGPDLLQVEDKRQILDAAQLGYSGVHLQVVASAARGGREAVECEIQIRTNAQDAWSVVSHKLLYKPVLTLPNHLQHAAYRLVALVELFDQEVQRIINALETLPGNEVVDLLDVCESRFLSLAHSPSNREFSVLILQVVCDAISADERPRYASLLDTFIEAEHDHLVSLYDEYGSHSAVGYIPEYVLFGQAESLLLLERLNKKRHKLAATWFSSDLPDSYLQALAEAAGISLDY